MGTCALDGRRGLEPGRENRGPERPETFGNHPCGMPRSALEPLRPPLLSIASGAIGFPVGDHRWLAVVLDPRLDRFEDGLSREARTWASAFGRGAGGGGP